MADTQGGIKLRYKRGTCFGCQKCLYCGVDLQQQKCKCKTSMIPNKKNWTTAVKYAFTRIFSPDWTKDKISFPLCVCLRIHNDTLNDILSKNKLNIINNTVTQ